MPVVKKPQSSVLAGTHNIDGAIVVSVSRTGKNTHLSEIIKMIEDSNSAVPKMQRIADKISGR